MSHEPRSRIEVNTEELEWVLELLRVARATNPQKVIEPTPFPALALVPADIAIPSTAALEVQQLALEAHIRNGYKIRVAAAFRIIAIFFSGVDPITNQHVTSVDRQTPKQISKLLGICLPYVRSCITALMVPALRHQILTDPSMTMMRVYYDVCKMRVAS